MRKMIIQGIPIQIEKKNIKNMYLHILPGSGEVRLTAPKRVSESVIRDYVESRISWIETNRKKMMDIFVFTEWEAVSGESCRVWGECFPLDVVDSLSEKGVRLEGDRLVLCASPDSTPEQRVSLLQEWYREQLREQVPLLLEQYEKLIGVKANEFRIRNMKTRWGTCNVEKKRIWLNLQLAQKPLECLRYIIVHELLHLLEPSHNQRFYRLLEQFYPDWKQVRNKLNMAP